MSDADARSKDPAAVPAFRIEVRVRNNRIIRARERLGHASGAAAAKALGIPYHSWVNYESMKESPLNADGAWKESALAVADALFAAPEDLWPDEALRITKARVTIEASFEQMTRAFGETPEHRMLVQGDRKTLETALAKLNKVEADVVLRGVVGEEELSDIAKSWDLSRARIGQVRDRALAKLRDELEDPDDSATLAAAAILAHAKQARCETCRVPYNDTFRTSEPRPGEFHYFCGVCWERGKG